MSPGGPWGGAARRMAPSSGDGAAHAEPSSGSGTEGTVPDLRPAGCYSRSSAYEPMARAMSAWAQKRWYVKTGAAPPLR